ncbi:hypothetical protein Pf1_00684 [Flavobacterium columnare]|nr:hypothetical protein Pf1_00684 [Flavobacterium columnare]
MQILKKSIDEFQRLEKLKKHLMLSEKNGLYANLKKIVS